MDQHVPVHLGTREHGVRLLAPPAVQLVITLITATVVSYTVMHIARVLMEKSKCRKTTTKLAACIKNFKKVESLVQMFHFLLTDMH